MEFVSAPSERSSSASGTPTKIMPTASPSASKSVRYEPMGRLPPKSERPRYGVQPVSTILVTAASAFCPTSLLPLVSYVEDAHCSPTKSATSDPVTSFK